MLVSNNIDEREILAESAILWRKKSLIHKHQLQGKH